MSAPIQDSATPSVCVHTFGGESAIEDFELDSYGITVGNTSIYEIPSYAMIALATQMVDHLMLNGHNFEIVETGEQDQKRRLVLKETK